MMYTENDLMEAIQDELQRSNKFRKKLEKAIKKKKKGLLRRFIESVARTIYGVIMSKIVRRVLLFFGF